MVGQEEAVTTVSKAIRRGHCGVKGSKTSDWLFLVLRPDKVVSKTELCKALAEAMFRYGKRSDSG